MSETEPPGRILAQDPTTRRRFLTGMAALALPPIMASTSREARAQSIKTKARIVIAGGGAAGLTAANRLAHSLDGASITVIEPRKEHWYQPGFTLIAAGIKPPNYSVSQTTDYLPRGIEFVAEKVAEIDPEGKKVVTDGGKTIAYDYLIVALGLELHYGGIEGMDIARIGQNGLGSLYLNPAAAAATYTAMSTFADKGGIGLFGRPAGHGDEVRRCTAQVHLHHRRPSASTR